MTAFLDAHVLLWALFSPSRLSTAAASLLRSSENTFLFSHATLAELLNKSGRGRIRIDGSSVNLLFEDIADFGVQFVPLLEADIRDAASLPQHHSHPFDRFLIAQAISRHRPILTADAMFRQYPVQTVW